MMSEKTIEGLMWILNDIEENGHYQVDLYADVIRAALDEIQRMKKSEVI